MKLKELNIDKSWSLFLDRDGVINKRPGNDYVRSWSGFEFLPGVLQVLKEFNAIFGRIVVVTNQQGIGKGFYTTEDLDYTHSCMVQEINRNGGRIDKVYFCPTLAIHNDIQRKPNPGMALSAQMDFPEIDFSKSIMVGDSVSDMEFGKRVGMVTVFISDDRLLAEDNKQLIDLSVESLWAFHRLLSKQ